MGISMSLAQSLKALADENRMKILLMLLNSDLCVGALANHVGISKPAVSQHLRILRKAGLVRGEKRGYWTHYRVDRLAIFLIAEELKKLGETRKTSNTICWRINEMPPDKPETKEVDMCQKCCQQPDKLQDKPENCTPEQIHKCHGDTKEHPCTKEDCTPKEK
jgi:DNA-binding transcriptional ArsR family regulator